MHAGLAAPIATANGPGPFDRVDAAASVGGKFYVTGGAQSCSGSSAATFEYDPSTDIMAIQSAAERGSIAARRDSPGTGKSTSLEVSRTVQTGSRPTPGLEAYDPTANTWTAINDAGTPTLRYATAMIWTGSALFVFGGSGDGQFDPERWGPP